MDSAEISELLRDGAASMRMLAELQGDSNHLRDAEKMEAAADEVYTQEDTIEELRAQLVDADRAASRLITSLYKSCKNFESTL
jgi:chemotaxis receptor (MCP) glutamine deamidase CheD